jgi:hypothetical protein
VSFDGGRKWKRFQLNLPVTPITDLKVHQGDLLASTAGRAFWILDDLSSLRQWNDERAKASVHLFKPRDAVRVQGLGGGFGGPDPRAGKNPPDGATIDFWLAKVPDGEVKIEVLDKAGKVIRVYSTKRPETDAPPSMQPPTTALTVKAGFNRMAFNLRHDQVVPVPGLFIFGSLQGRRVLPGEYQVRLTASGASQTAPFTVKMDPRVSVSAAELQAQDDLGAKVDSELNDLHRGVVRLRQVRSQVDDLLKRMKGAADAGDVEKSGKSLVEKLNALEDALVQKRVVDGQTVINFPMRLNQFYIYLRSAIDESTLGPTDGQRDRLADLSKQWHTHQTALAAALDKDLSAFNRLVRERPAPAILVP